SLTEVLKNKDLNRIKYFSFGFYIDTYYNWTLANKGDTSDIIPFSSNCPVADQIRMNHAAIEIYYNSEVARGKLILQYGDAPNLLAAPNAQFIKNLRQANFGFRIAKKAWLDFGYFLNPIGIESSWAVLNQLSTVTTGGYYEPGNLLGVKLSFTPSDQFNIGGMFGNPYSVAYAKNQHFAGVFFLNYTPFKNLTVTYNNLFGNQALIDAQIDNNILYNNLIVKYSPVKPLWITGQLDFAVQSNSQLPPDTNKSATMFSGFIMARYEFNEHLSITARYEFFNDPDGYLSGVYKYDGKTSGLKATGYTAGFEFKPVKFGYVRIEYRYLATQKGNFVFSGNTSDIFQALTITTGMRF
ncbi:MAG: outer membrane beta-barrel protein, partial [Bacteroidota bacterium]